jgi:hypothetical protein
VNNQGRRDVHISTKNSEMKNVMLGRYIPSSEENSAVMIERKRRELSRMYARRETPGEGNL